MHVIGNLLQSGFRTFREFLPSQYDKPLVQVIGCRWLMPWEPGGCFTNVLRALKNTLLKFVHCRNHTSYENFNLKLCACAQGHALGTHTFQLEILTRNVISSIVYFNDYFAELAKFYWNSPQTWRISGWGRFNILAARVRHFQRDSTSWLAELTVGILYFALGKKWNIYFEYEILNLSLQWQISIMKSQ